MNFNNLLGDNLIFLRGLMGVTQCHVAEMMHMSRSAYAAIESGTRHPTVDDLRIMEQTTRFSADTLINMNLRKQMILVLDAARQTGDVQGFINEYLKLSANGRHRIDDYMNLTSERETTMMAVLAITEDQLNA